MDSTQVKINNRKVRVNAKKARMEQSSEDSSSGSSSETNPIAARKALRAQVKAAKVQLREASQALEAATQALKNGSEKSKLIPAKLISDKKGSRHGEEIDVSSSKPSRPQGRGPRKSIGGVDAQVVKLVEHCGVIKVTPGAQVTKTLQFLNSGASAWPSTSKLVLLGNHAGENNAMVLGKAVHPGDKVEFDVQLTAPMKAGRHAYLFSLCTADDIKFGQRARVAIVVEDSISESSEDTSSSDVESASTATVVVKQAPIVATTPAPLPVPLPVKATESSDEAAAESSGEVLPVRIQFKDQLKQLRAMGFFKHRINVELLSKFNGDINMTVKELSRMQLEKPAKVAKAGGRHGGARRDRTAASSSEASV